MTNFLDMRCPKCGNENQLGIQASVWIRVCEDGTDADLPAMKTASIILAAPHNAALAATTVPFASSNLVGVRQ